MWNICWPVLPTLVEKIPSDNKIFLITRNVSKFLNPKTIVANTRIVVSRVNPILESIAVLKQGTL